MTHNESGGIYGLSVLTPIVPGREGPLRRYVRALGLGADSPLHRVEATHFGRWLVVGQLVYEGPPQRPDRLKSEYLLFTAYFDGSDPGRYVHELVAKCPEAGEIWRHCVGCPPEVSDRRAFVRYLLHNQIDTALLYTAYTVGVPEVRAALELRERLLQFALAAQGRDQRALLEDWRATFGSAG